MTHRASPNSLACSAERPTLIGMLKSSVVLLAIFFQLSCATVVPTRKNDAAKNDAPYVVLVSIDGYRWDYTQKFNPPFLSRISEQGARAESLIPVFPSKTFPNHYSIATGLVPGNHGLVSNEFMDPTSRDRYAIKDRAAVADARWYFGEPIWNTVEKNGLLSANCFWVGSEAAIGGARATYWLPYDDQMPKEARVYQVLAWLQLPAENRPHFVTLYFSAVDSAGHAFGPDSAETKNAVRQVDQALEDLRSGLEKTGLPINLLIVSDHGMLSLDEKKHELFGDEASDLALADFEIIGSGNVAFLYYVGPEGGKVEAAARAAKLLSAKAKHFKVFNATTPALIASLPKSLFPQYNSRFGDLILVADPPYTISQKKPTRTPPAANHGWDPLVSHEMHGIFYAQGPAFKPRSRVGPVSNIHLVPLIAKILDLPPPTPIDGSLDALSPLLKRR